jgi:hypothetical protein
MKSTPNEDVLEFGPAYGSLCRAEWEVKGQMGKGALSVGNILCILGGRHCLYATLLVNMSPIGGE